MGGAHSAHDAIVIGAGHNGLVCAAYLARGGLDVLVLEARSPVGGCASTVDALDGARVNVCNCDHSLVLATPIPDELDLAAFGLRYLEVEPMQLSMDWDGEPPWFLFRDRDRGFAPGFSGTPLSVLTGRDRELTRYETPVRGLYVTGAGTFPGAGVWGGPGRNAAHVVLSRLGRS